jgi:LysM repeat protein
MSKEAKVGLLLGLALIVGIVLVLRGLHGNEEAKLEEELSISNQLVNRSDSVEEESVDIPSAVGQLSHHGTPIPAVAKNDPDIRYVGDLPGGISDQSKQTGGLVILPPVDPLSGLKSLTEPVDGDKSVVEVVLSRSKAAEPQPKRIYVVSKGDCLERIALRVYGKIEGKKPKNIDGIFLANKDKMRSKHTVYIGQKLVIPRLPGELGALDLVATNQATRQDKPEVKQSSGQVYLVRKYDSLWDIAEEKLGSGLRYKEIKELNHLKSDDINEGQKLRLPSR